MVHWSVLVQAGWNFTSDFLGLVVTNHFWSFKKKVFFPQKHCPSCPTPKEKV